MNLNRQKGITQLVVLGLMAFLALGLPLTTKLVQQNQENRSQAEEDTEIILADLPKVCTPNTGRKCENGKLYACDSNGLNWKAPTNCVTGACKSDTACSTVQTVGQKCASTYKNCTAAGVAWYCSGGKIAKKDCKASNQDCKNGACVAKQVCTPNTGKKCGGGKLYTCNSNGSAWKPTPTNCVTGACKSDTACSTVQTVGQKCASTYKNCTAAGVAWYCSGGKIAKKDCKASNQDCKNGACVAKPICTDYNYNNTWTSCSSSSGKKTRNYNGYLPANCTGKPTKSVETKECCAPLYDYRCNNNKLEWCNDPNWVLGEDCGTNKICDVEAKACIPVPKCTDYTFSEYGNCYHTGIQYRTKTGKTPIGCTGEPPIEKLILSRECTPSCNTLGGSCVTSGTCVGTELTATGCTSSKPVCCKANIKVTNITISPQSKTIIPGQSFIITTSVLPTNATNKSLKWESNNASVAIVSSNGTVTAKEPGKATITVSSVENDSIKKMVVVTVNQSESDETTSDVVNITKYSLSLKPTSLTLGVNKSAFVQPTLTPKRTTEVLTWKSNNNGIARVYIPYCSGNYFTRCVGSNFYLDGTVKKCTKCAGIRQVKIVGLKKGTAIITVTASPSGAKETIKVIVK